MGSIPVRRKILFYAFSKIRKDSGGLSNEERNNVNVLMVMAHIVTRSGKNGLIIQK